MSDELIDLQTTVAFQERNLNELADILTAQQKQLDVLRAEVQLLRERVAYLEAAPRQQAEPFSAAEERPPHY
ncbi:MAG: SlyX family protein [Pseudomonadales bacterium]|jgi:SlyX protein|nr:SlyX family protein [Pseudomonadales bacterium]